MKPIRNQIERWVADLRYHASGHAARRPNGESDPTVAVCLITCGRYDYTKKTVEKFVQYNDPSRFKLLHADDASEDNRVCKVANEFGFRTISKSATRQGNMETIRRAVRSAGASWILILENDWESVRPFPWDSFNEVVRRPEIYCFRLCGVFKERGRRPFETNHAGRGKTPVEWQPFGEEMQVASVHWSNAPSVTRTAELNWLLAGSSREKEVSVRSGKLALLTARVKDNVFYHMGDLRTAEFKR